MLRIDRLNVNQLSQNTIIVYLICRSAQQAILNALATSPSAFENALDQYIDWTPEAAAALEESIRSGPIEAGCSTDQVRK